MMKKIFLGLLIASSLLIAGCNSSKSGTTPTPDGDNTDVNPDTPVTPTDPDDGKITIKFYLDYNQIMVDNCYATYKVDNNSKLTEPTRPTSADAPLPEFPVFKGWSKKQIVDNDADIWNFETDVVNLESGYKTFRLYGYWVATGEQI